MIIRIITFIILILCSPLFIFIAALVYIEDGRPILFKQIRPGKDHKLFTLYKFRTMKTSTPEVATHLLENPKKYLLKVGFFLRKFSLDELPNLINVLRGDITLVGPRPALYNQYDLILLRELNGIHMLKPGITGWAQINGRDELSIEEKVLYEKYYLTNKSWFFDFKIILLTIKFAIMGKGVSH